MPDDETHLVIVLVIQQVDQLYNLLLVRTQLIPVLAGCTHEEGHDMRQGPHVTAGLNTPWLSVVLVNLSWRGGIYIDIDRSNVVAVMTYVCLEEITSCFKFSQTLLMAEEILVDTFLKNTQVRWCSCLVDIFLVLGCLSWDQYVCPVVPSCENRIKYYWCCNSYIWNKELIMTYYLNSSKHLVAF